MRACLLLALALWQPRSCSARPTTGRSFAGRIAAASRRTPTPLPVTFSDTENVRWSPPSATAWAARPWSMGRVFVSGMTGKETVSLFAFDAATGNKLWQRDWPTGALPEVHQTNSHASSTPAADAERVYFYFSSLGMLARRRATRATTCGGIRCRCRSSSSSGAPACRRCSTATWCLFCQDDDLNPALIRLRPGHRQGSSGKTTGSTWRSTTRIPVINTVDGRDEIVVAGTGLLIGYDPADGQAPLARQDPAAQHQDHARLRRRRDLCLGAEQRHRQPVAGRRRSGRHGQQRRQGRQGRDPGLCRRDRRRPRHFFERTFDRGDANDDGYLEGAELDARLPASRQLCRRHVHFAGRQRRGRVHSGRARRRHGRRDRHARPLEASAPSTPTTSFRPWWPTAACCWSKAAASAPCSTPRPAARCAGRSAWPTPPATSLRP